jgi:hypothetical protein
MPSGANWTVFFSFGSCAFHSSASRNSSLPPAAPGALPRPEASLSAHSKGKTKSLPPLQLLFKNNKDCCN